MANVVTGTADLNVGYIEFILDGTDYSGHYSTRTDNNVYQYDVKMDAFLNKVNKEMYWIFVEWSDNHGHSGQWEVERGQGETLHISNGHFKVRSCYIDKTEPV